MINIIFDILNLLVYLYDKCINDPIRRAAEECPLQLFYATLIINLELFLLALGLITGFVH